MQYTYTLQISQTSKEPRTSLEFIWEMSYINNKKAREIVKDTENRPKIKKSLGSGRT